MRWKAWLAAGLWALSAAAADARQIHVFGDSLVDAGNVWTLSGGLIPWSGQGYFEGRFTNGLTYVDHLQLSLSGRPSEPWLRGGTNYAFGGARGAGVGGLPVPSLSDQLALWGFSQDYRARRSDLYLINMGGNDAIALASGDLGGLTPAAYTGLYVDRVLSTVGTLWWLGARDIVVMGVPNPTPEGAALDRALAAGLASLPRSIRRNTTRYDVQDFFGRLTANPPAFGLAPELDLTTACWSVRPVVAGRVDCRGFLDFDGLHPTAEVHAALAFDLKAALGFSTMGRAMMLESRSTAAGAVPEPQAWVLLIAGFGLVGARLRQRQALREESV